MAELPRMVMALKGSATSRTASQAFCLGVMCSAWGPSRKRAYCLTIGSLLRALRSVIKKPEAEQGTSWASVCVGRVGTETPAAANATPDGPACQAAGAAASAALQAMPTLERLMKQGAGGVAMDCVTTGAEGASGICWVCCDGDGVGCWASAAEKQPRQAASAATPHPDERAGCGLAVSRPSATCGGADAACAALGLVASRPFAKKRRKDRAGNACRGTGIRFMAWCASRRSERRQIRGNEGKPFGAGPISRSDAEFGWKVAWLAAKSVRGGFLGKHLQECGRVDHCGTPGDLTGVCVIDA